MSVGIIIFGIRGRQDIIIHRWFQIEFTLGFLPEKGNLFYVIFLLINFSSRILYWRWCGSYPFFFLMRIEKRLGTAADVQCPGGVLCESCRKERNLYDILLS